MKKMFSILLVVVMLCMAAVMLTGCGRNLKSEVVGVWEPAANDATAYAYYYEDGTGDRVRFDDSDPDGFHFNSFVWEIEGEYVRTEDTFGTVKKYSIKDGNMYNSQGKHVFTQVSKDPTINMYKPSR